MTLVSGKISNLLNGVSQRDKRTRAPSRVEEQENGSSHYGTGSIRKRPPTVHVAELEEGVSAYTDRPFVHLIDRDRGNKYRLVIRDGDLKAFDATTGEELTVNFPDGKGYLVGDEFRAISVEDRTYILNRNDVAAKGTDSSDALQQEALVWIREGAEDTRYSITVGGFPAASTTTAAAATDLQYDTRDIVDALVTSLEGKSGFTDEFNASAVGSCVYISRNNNQPFTVEATDGLGGQATQVIYNTVRSQEDLPPLAPDGFIVEVVGSPETDFDNYWVRWNDDDGVWEETLAPSLIKNLDPTTMPHRLDLKGNLQNRYAAKSEPPNPTVSRAAGDAATASFDVGSGSQTLNSDGDTLDYTIPATYQGSSYDYSVAFVYNTDPLSPSNEMQVFLEAYDSGNNLQKTLESVSIAPDESGTLTLNGTYNAASGDYIQLRITFDSTPTATEAYVVVGDPHLTITEVGTRFNFGESDLYPGGFQLTLTFATASETYNYTPTEDETGAEVAVGFESVIDTAGVFTVDVSSPGVLDITGTNSDDGAFSEEFDSSTDAWFNTDLSEAALAGTTVTNITDGSTATVSSVTFSGIKTGGLSGGTDNTFEAADLIELAETGAYFQFHQVDWDDREVGDDTTNPMPDFINRSLTDLTYYQGRLGFIYKDRIYFSAAGEPERLFRESARNILDSDPIAAESTLPEVSAFIDAINWNKSLYLRSERGLVLVSGNPILTPTTISLDTVVGLEGSASVRPVVVGSNLYMARETNTGSQVHELRQLEVDVVSVNTLTDHVPDYIGAPVKLAGSGAHDTLVVLPEDSSEIYILETTDQGRDRVQAAWSKWVLPTGSEVLSVDVFQGQVGLVVKYNDGVYLETLDLEDAVVPSREGDVEAKSRHLDRRLTDQSTGVSSSYDSGTDTTTWTLPYDIATDGSEGSVAVVSRVDGTRYTVTRPSASEVAVAGQGDLTSTSVYIGVQYTQKVVPSQIYLRGDGREPETKGRLRLGYVDIGYEKTTDLKVTVSSPGRDAVEYTVDDSSPTTGVLRVYVGTRNEYVTITIENDTPGGSGISYIEWEGERTVRSRS